MDDQTDVRADTGARAVTAARSTQLSASSRVADHTDLSPSTDDELLVELTPCLQLVAPVGMTIEEQDTWFEAAMRALDGIPLGLLKRGAAAAMRTADHHSKIVPAIMAEIEGDWQWRKRNRSASRPAPLALPAPGGEQPTRSELDEICKRYGVGRYAAEQPGASPHLPTRVATTADPDRPCRMPTAADYKRLFGIDPAEERAKGDAMRAADATLDNVEVDPDHRRAA